MAVLLCGCLRDEEAEPKKNPTIAFKTGAGYTFANDTVPQNDTLLIGAVMERGDDRLVLFKLLSRFDNNPALTADSLADPGSSFTFDKTILTRSQPGTEVWTFWLQENDGDIIRRSITLTVQ